jgi:hypothetical protein
MPTRRTKARTLSPLSLFPMDQDRDPEVLDVQATACMLGISTHAVYTLFKKGELPGRKVARRWLKGSSEADALTRAIANGDQKALTAALKSGKAHIKKCQ